MFLTIIIPIYNALPYLRQCVESVFRLSVEEKEIILIDDGSTDGSGKLCDVLLGEWEQRQPFHPAERMIVVHQCNLGVSAARNRGLQEASGEWVWMIDADDRLADTPISYPNRDVLSKKHWVMTGFVWEESGLIQEYSASAHEIPYNLWRCWFRRNTIEQLNLRFTEGRKYAEDQEFILRFMQSLHHPALSVALMPDAVYHYTLREGSAMTKTHVKTKKLKDIASVLLGVFVESFRYHNINKKWVWRELKRLSKTWIVTLIR